MFTRGSRRRRSARNPPESEDPQRGQPCEACGDQCPGFLVHSWRKICRHCLCPRGEHAAGGVPPELQRSLSRLVAHFPPPPKSGSDDGSGCTPEEYTWAPPGLTPQQVRQYFGCLPPEEVPLRGSPGERYRLRQLLLQLPPHDSEPQFCHALDEAERRELLLFAQQRKRENLGRGLVRPLPLSGTGTICQQCGGAVPAGALGVFAGRAGLGACWHPQCFRCRQCRALLAELLYWQHRGHLFCGRHHAERQRHRCPACDELIFSGRWAEAGGRRWHLRHWRCLECERPLPPPGPELRVPLRRGLPFCRGCDRRRHAQLCDGCGRPIGVEHAQLSHEGQHWHARPACFCCAACARPLLGRPFLPRGGQLFCSAPCARRARPPPPPPRPRAPGRGQRAAARRSWAAGGQGPEPRFCRDDPRRHSLPELGAACPSPPALPPSSSPPPTYRCPSPNPPSSPPSPPPPQEATPAPSPRLQHPPKVGEGQGGRGRRPRWPSPPSPSPSSSSSSSSEDDGLFLGEPIPLPPQLRPPGPSTPPRTPPRRPPRPRGCLLA